MGLTSHNLLLTASFQVKLSGIGMTGLKTFLRDSNQGYDEDRHQAWVAPELLDGQSPAISPAADVYAFGIILWELLSRMDPHGLTKQIRAGHLPLPDQAPRRYRALLQQCCHLQPSMRPECSEILPQLTIEFQRQ
jgi:serine/threonine protein kinase